MTTVPAATGRSYPQGPAALRMTPGRRALLAVGVPVILLAIAWTGFGLISTFGTASFAIGGPIPEVNGQVVAFFGGADVAVSETGGSTAQLTGEAKYSLVRPKYSMRSGPSGTVVKLACGLPTGNCQLSTDLAVPAGAGVNLASQGGDMQVSGVTGDTTLSSAGGDVTVFGGGSRTSVNTGGGDLTAGNLSGTLNLNSVGGDVAGNNLAAPATTVSSGGGDVTVAFSKVPDHVNITSAGGNVTVLLPRGSTHYDISESTDGGDYNVSVPVGSSSHTITVDSGGGDVAIAQAG